MSADGGVVPAAPLLRLSQVAFSYRDRRGRDVVTLENIDVVIKDGEFVCVLGPSGSGKTTLLKVLGGFLAPAKGGVLLRERELTECTPHVVMIFQEPNLFSWLTVEGNVMFGPRVAGRSKAEARPEVDALLKRVGLYETRHRYPHQLSGGMRQRTAIARALAARPNALLLDEPFSALDVVLRRHMQQFIRGLWQTQKTTMIMVTHSIEEALLCGERILVLGGQPASVLEDIDVSGPELKDRYSPAFAHMQQRLERLIGEAERSDESGIA